MNNFDSIFQIYVGLNFGYAIIENTRPDFFGIISNNLEKLNELEEKVKPEKISRSELGKEYSLSDDEASKFEEYASSREIEMSLVSEARKSLIESTNPTIIIKGSFFFGYFSFFILLVNAFKDAQLDNDDLIFYNVLIILNILYSTFFIFSSKCYNYKEITGHFFIYLISSLICYFALSNVAPNLILTARSLFKSLLVLQPISHFIYYIIKLGFYDKLTLMPLIKRVDNFLIYSSSKKEEFKSMMEIIKNRSK